MQKPVLVILAAGMGSRYGGLKQIDPVDAQGNFIIDYSVYDAIRAGFSRVVCIIKSAMAEDFLEVFGRRIADKVQLDLAFQDIHMLPDGYAVPDGREKPWGTGHALLCAKELVDSPFAVINADDYYGPHAYESIYGYLSAPHQSGQYAMVGYSVENTLTDHGAVTRGVCLQGESGYLQRIEEIQGICRQGDGGAYEKDGKTVFLPAGTTISMNFWGFDPSLFTQLEKGFPVFLDAGLAENPMKCEYLLPSAIHDLLHENVASVKVLRSRDAWFGVTYREDKPLVEQAIRQLKAQGAYAENLWG